VKRGSSAENVAPRIVRTDAAEQAFNSTLNRYPNTYSHSAFLDRQVVSMLMLRLYLTTYFMAPLFAFSAFAVGTVAASQTCNGCILLLRTSVSPRTAEKLHKEQLIKHVRCTSSSCCSLISLRKGHDRQEPVNMGKIFTFTGPRRIAGSAEARYGPNFLLSIRTYCTNQDAACNGCDVIHSLETNYS
jgi:hypothetical protein